jgi:hypothetical protein
MNKKILTLLVSLILLGSSCTKFLGVDEVNPNSASVVPPKLLLPAALTNIVKTMDNPRRFEFVYLWYGLWSISQGYSQPSALMQYRLLNSNYQVAFQNLYTTGQNFKQIQKEATDPNDAGYVAISMIMNAYIMQNLVDIWGNVPYTEAFSAESGIFKPKYDDQKAIYEDEVLKLDAAIKLIQGLTVNATTISASSDVMFGGNMDLWARFANTLKLRMLVHQSGMTGRDAYIKAALATTSSVGFLGAGEGAMVNPGFIETDTQMNPFYEVFFNGAAAPQSDATAYYFAGKDAVDFMVANADPRLGRFFLPYSGTSYAGNYLGQDVIADPPRLPGLTSKLGYSKGSAGYIIGTPTQSSPVLTDFESLFIQSEAVVRGYITGDAKALYNSAVTQSFISRGLTAVDATTYYSQAKFTTNYDNATDKIGLILTQKWLALNGTSPVEIWTDFRRSGYPQNLHFSKQADRANDTPPVRLLYPQTEISSNNDNVVAVGAIDPFTSKIFWQNR